ncbi:UDP-N-acetylmuramate--L-alanine ligase [Myxococcota bacterium]|nr:UDP-N-acetylmuramate--L-alanine ligase [Myxococcota bacterium]MBU1430515.1 UDP-N-acetylmuramate--L-alanine ligase [Myxococcota bacterium]MBU1900146.1 UDP-N-acetylmuramate--L-alanine ligase [Myxococcota bacterium]
MLDTKDTYHFIGIGGIGVSAVARVLHQQGVRVRGSDVRESQLTEGLRALGIPVQIGHDAAHVEGADVVVHSTAVPEDNLERCAARALGLREAHRSALLGLCMINHEQIGVTGTHGKGTVSAMITHCLIEAGEDPTFIIGGLLNQYGTNARAGRGRLAVAEIDESDKSHLNLQPHHVVINNLEVDHLNFYKDLNDITATMARFIQDNPRLKTVVINGDDAGTRALIEALDRPVLRFGAVEADLDFAAREIIDEGDAVRFTAYHGDVALGAVRLPLPGAYNAENAAAAIAVTVGVLGLPFARVAAALSGYMGLENRFTVRRAGGITIVKDYISHPTGMRKVLESARRMRHARILCVFKPYRFTLMRYHGEEYAEAFTGADEVLITTMYAAEERPIDGIDTPWFVEVLRGAGNRVTFIPDNADVIPALADKIEAGDMVIFFGGDDFFRMADAWAEQLDA